MANSKITALTDIVTPAVADIIPIVDDVAGTPTTKKATLQEVFDLYKDLTITETNKTLTSPVLSDAVPTADGAIGFDRTLENLVVGDGTAGQLVHMGAWTAFTPSWTNLTVGSGSSSGYYCKIGKTVHFRVYFTFAADSSVSGTPKLALPLANYTTSVLHTIGIVNYRDNGGSDYNGAIDQSGNLLCYQAGSTYVTQIGAGATTPFTFATGDQISVTGTYQTSA